MSDPAQQPRRKSTLIPIVVLLSSFGAGYLASGIVRFLSGIAPEYHSAAAIREITDFVEKNKAWPTSWRSTGLEPLSRVTVNWSLDLNTCDRHDVMMSVAPQTGGFYTYPHAKRQLEHLWQVVVKVREAQGNQEDNRSRRQR